MKNGKNIGFYLLTVFSFLLLSGCVNDIFTEEGLSARTEYRILSDYFNAYVKGQNGLELHNIWINGYYGTYNDVVAVSIAGPWDDPPFRSLHYTGFSPDDEFKHLTKTTFFLSGNHRFITFCYPSGINLLFYKDRKFIDAKGPIFIESYVSFNDLRSIAALVNSTEIFGRFDGLDAEIEMRIIQDFNEKYDPGIFYTIYDRHVINYFGTYNGSIVLTITNQTRSSPLQHQFNIGGVDFDYTHNGYRVYFKVPIVWNNGNIYNGLEDYAYMNSGLGLREAYDLNLLSEDDLKEIYYQIKLFLEITYGG